MYHFCTYFDRNYLPRGLALHHSLRAHCSEFTLWVLCLDQSGYEYLTQLGLPEIKPIALQDFERDDEDLAQAKQNRSLIEYYFTLSPSLPLYILKHYPKVDLITYVDADLFFFASPAPVFDEMGTSSIAIIGHRFAPQQRQLDEYGIYNVGWLSFRRDENGLACLRWWRERCNEWCYDRLEAGRFADQKYLDEWPSRFSGVKVLEHKGANVAPWNVSNYTLHRLDQSTILVDDQPLIFFHFHGLKKVKNWLYYTDWKHYGETRSKVLRRDIYGHYLKALVNVDILSAPKFDTIPVGLLRGVPQQRMQDSKTRSVRRRIQTLPIVFSNVITGNYRIVFKGCVI